MLAVDRQIYWSFFTNPTRFASPEHADFQTASSFDASWPTQLQWQSNDFEQPGELIWLLTLPQDSFDRLMLAAGAALRLPELRLLIGRKQRETVRHSIGHNLFDYLLAQGSLGSHPDMKRPESVAKLSREQLRTDGSASICSALLVFGERWQYAFDLRLPSSGSNQLSGENQSPSRASAMGQLVWLHDELWPIANSDVFQSACLSEDQLQ